MLGGEIISADSRQVYRGLDLGTGKDLDEYRQAGVRCHLIDIVDPMDVYSLFRYVDDCYQAVRDVLARGRVPVLAGGTGLYVEAVVRGYRIPNVPEDPDFRERMQRHSVTELRELVAALPADLARDVDISSGKRMIRALEVAAWAEDHELQWGGADRPEIIPQLYCVTMPRPEIVRRIDARLDQRLHAGMIDEVAALRSSGVSDERLEQLGLEYRYCGRYCAGQLDYAGLREELAIAIHQFSKRQMTWFAVWSGGVSPCAG
jgi:tRNA dimethylallyltransferase